MARLSDVEEALARRGFETRVCRTSAEAAEVIREELAKADSVGFGGSKTISGLGIQAMARAAGKKLYWHGDPELPAERKLETMRGELGCDLFLLSANAVTADGAIVNIDGNGNRVAASIFGPKRVVFVVGRNKVVEGGVEEAIARIKREACPPNCRRLGRKTPCAATGECADCSSPDRICNVTVVLDRRPRPTPMLVVLVDEDLGY